MVGGVFDSEEGTVQPGSAPWYTDHLNRALPPLATSADRTRMFGTWTFIIPVGGCAHFSRFPAFQKPSLLRGQTALTTLENTFKNFSHPKPPFRQPIFTPNGSSSYRTLHLPLLHQRLPLPALVATPSTPVSHLRYHTSLPYIPIPLQYPGLLHGNKHR
ncbi:hypothetical protein CA85_40630 [Allorhodopirellula solitaria]|uniref:Uncharacterized protein n=1 Tax=Allorhodopirellula solitaria TaxID=2527987 RepID=A0A5C5X152_9BACT|nr:hypothetical protein CA85_40630 [Allorhodopirellula solitaria]